MGLATRPTTTATRAASARAAPIFPRMAPQAITRAAMAMPRPMIPARSRTPCRELANRVSGASTQSSHSRDRMKSHSASTA